MSLEHTGSYLVCELGTPTWCDQFASYRFKSAVPEAHIEEVLEDTLHETIVVTAALHCAQHVVHPAKVTTFGNNKSTRRYPSENHRLLDIPHSG
jgi:hypothetical protein